ncbi:MAG TPA: YHS domain-containing protein [Candidatus Polarisedimenticolia bacterium]|nr:YHS domain-containing protein [Candidatus Polarisedimenticolia bacterium]
MTRDVVCGMQVDEASSPHKSDFGGKTYAFCSPGCKKQFDQQPEAYAGKSVPDRAVR